VRGRDRTQGESAAEGDVTNTTDGS
jgi:hypothetical protein